MRSTRVLVVGAALSASLVLAGAGAAFADDGQRPQGKPGVTAQGEDKKGDDKGDWHGMDPKGGVHAGGGFLAQDPAGKQDDGKKDEGKKDEGKGGWHGTDPKGGVHAGGGFLALTSDDRPAGADGKDAKGDAKGDMKADGKGDAKGHDDKKGEHGSDPKGGVHAGGGGLTASGTDVLGASALLLGGAGATVVAVRRRRAGRSAAV